MPAKKNKKNLPPHLANGQAEKRTITPALSALLNYADKIGYEPNGLKDFVVNNPKHKKGSLDAMATWITSEPSLALGRQGLEALDGYVRFMEDFLTYTKNLSGEEQIELLLNIKGWLKVRGFQGQKDLKDILIEVSQNGITNKVVNACNNYRTLDQLWEESYQNGEE